MKRRALVAASLALVGVVLFFGEKFFEQLYFRITAEPAPAASDAGSGAHVGRAAVRLIDFRLGDEPGVPSDARARERNLAFAPVVSGQEQPFFEQSGVHELMLAHLVARPLQLSSHKTFIEYERGRLRSASIYLAREAMDYRGAVALVGRTMSSAGLDDRFSIDGYDAHLGEVTDKEPWAPAIELTYFELRPMLNCNWQWHVPARDQLERVRCRPYLSIAGGQR